MVMWRWRSKKEEGSAKDERHTQLLQKQQKKSLKIKCNTKKVSINTYLNVISYAYKIW